MSSFREDFREVAKEYFEPLWKFVKWWGRVWTAPCVHDWRPCVTQLVAWHESKPARICALCKDWEPLTEGEFYAQFGENFYEAAQKAKAQ